MSAPDIQQAAHAAADAASAVMTPTQRLELSRARMRVFLDKRKPGAAAGAGGSAGFTGKMSEWSAELRANPLMGAVVDAVHNWWVSHPLRTATLLAGDAIEDVAVPYIQRYPLAFVGGSLAVGVVLSKLKPWRWLGRPALFAGLASQVAAQLMTHAPLEFVIDFFTKVAKPKPPTAAASGMPATDSTLDPSMPDDGIGIDPGDSVLAPLPGEAPIGRPATAAAF